MITFKKIYEDAKIPSKGTSNSAGWDMFLYSPENNPVNPIILRPGVLYKGRTGISLAMPLAHFGMIRSRSSSFIKGLLVNGTIDEDYSGEISLLIRNISNEELVLTHGSSYAQMILVPYFNSNEFAVVNQLPETERGSNGFGSTGNT